MVRRDIAARILVRRVRLKTKITGTDDAPFNLCFNSGSIFTSIISIRYFIISIT